jgi:hypothetical protein
MFIAVPSSTPSWVVGQEEDIHAGRCGWLPGDLKPRFNFTKQ